MKNARNAVSGLVNSKTVDVKIAKLTDFVTYALLHPRYKQSDQMVLLKELGFNTVINKKLNNLTEDILKKYLTDRKKQSLYEMDGLVISDDSTIYEHKGGYPEHSFAFKMMIEDQVVIATVIRVIWNPSMNGYLKPTVEIEPVDLFGTTVTYATGKNAKFIVDNKIGKGAKIKITKGGEVIPDILQVVKEGKEGAQLPDLDEDDYDWNETEVDFVLTNLEGDNAVIVNTKLITYFFKTIGVKYLSEGIITKLVDEGYDTIIKILKADKKKLSKIEGLGEKVINKIYDEIDRAFDEIDLVTFMAASHKFGKGLGEKKIREILNMYPNILIEDWSKKEMINNILEVNGFSNKLAELFTNKFNEFKKFYQEISKIKDLSRFEEEITYTSDSDSDSEDLIFEGKSIVFTGFRDKDLEKTIIDLGGKVAGSVSSKTFILICKDDADKSSSKLKKATDIGVKVMTKSEFIDEYDL
jgi:NAD-dependent DNA ligase